jgi:predicted TIM-barrel fold metal-dependent hydrolase
MWGGRREVLFGSNFPMLTPQQAMTGLEELDLDEETRRCFLYENARRVFDLGSGATR